MCHRPSVSLNKEKVSREISENKIAVCEKTQGLRSGNFSDLNSACSTGTFQCHSKRPNLIAIVQNANMAPR